MGEKYFIVMGTELNESWFSNLENSQAAAKGTANDNCVPAEYRTLVQLLRKIQTQMIGLKSLHLKRQVHNEFERRQTGEQSQQSTSGSSNTEVIAEVRSYWRREMHQCYLQ